MKNLVLYKIKSVQIAKILVAVIIVIIYVKSDIKMYDPRINSLGDYLIYINAHYFYGSRYLQWS